MSGLEGYDMKKIAAMIRAKGLDPADLEQTAVFIRDLANEDDGEVVFSTPIRNVKGLTVTVLIRNIEEKENVNNKKMRHEYRLLVCTFEDVVVPGDLGEKIDDTEISLKLEKRIKMTLDERSAYLAAVKITWKNPEPPTDYDIAHALKLEKDQEVTPGIRKGFMFGLPLKDDGYSSKREYFVERNAKVSLFAGTEIRITSFEGQFVHANNMPLEEGEFAICKGLYCEETIKAGEASFGHQWKVQSKTGKLEEDTNHSTDDVRRMLTILQRGNDLLNVGDNNPEFNQENETEDDTLFRRQAEAGQEMKNWQKDAVLLGHLPQLQRPLAKRVIVVPLQGTDADAEFLARSKKVLIKKPFWNPEYAGKKADDSPIKLGAFQAKCRIIEPDNTGRYTTSKDALVQMQLFDKHMVRFGVMDYDTFENIAGSYVPHCRGFIAGRMDVGASHAMDESTYMGNRQNPDGTWPKDVSFGVFAYAELLDIDLASGVIQGGLHITPDCAKAAMESKHKSCDFSINCPATVKSLAAQNPLNKIGGKPPIINMLEAQHSLPQLITDYQFFLVTSIPIEDAKEKIELIQSKYPKNYMEKMSELIMGGTVKDIGDWPVKLNNKKLFYTVFAVRNNIAEDTVKSLADTGKKDEGALVEAYVAAINKRKDDETRRAKHNEVDAINALPAEALADEPPQKRQKAAEQPQKDTGAGSESHNEDEQPGDAGSESHNEDEQEETSTKKRTKRTRRPRKPVTDSIM